MSDPSPASYHQHDDDAWSGGGSNMSIVDTVPRDMLHLVDEYWYQFPPVNPLWHTLLGCIIALLSVVSICGNGMVIYIFSTAKSLKTPSNLLVINLAMADFLLMFSMGPTMAYNSFNEAWTFGPFMCELYGCFGSLFGCVSIWSMTMIAFDRHNVIVKGFSGKPLTYCGAVLRLALVWATSLAWTLAPLFGWNRYVPEGIMTVCGTDYLTKTVLSRSYVFIYAGWVYFLPLFLIIYSYFFIVKAVSSHEKQMREQAKKMNVASLRSSEQAKANAEIRLAKIAMMTISLWFMAWTPYLLINFVGIFELAKVSPLATISGSLFAKANAVYNPIVYGISHPKYRQALNRRFPILGCRVSPEEGGSVVSGTTNLSVSNTSSMRN